jgi:hypothetical protein
MIKINNNGHKIMTPQGYKSFSGVQKLLKDCISLKTLNYNLSCSYNHPICVNFENQSFEVAKNLNIGDSVYTISGYETIIEKILIGVDEVYDILGVEDTQSYYTNGILSHNCQFLDDGTSAIDAELFDNLKKDCKEPKIILDDGYYKIWEEPDPSRLYVAGVDVSEGVGGDASVIQMLDITDLKDIRQVAEYHNNLIAPSEFSNKLHDILLNWGSPLVLIERNNQGGQVCDRLAMDFAYEKVVSWGGKQAHKNQLFGVISHTNTKHAAILNQRYFINEIRNVKFRSIHTLNEFKTFVRYPNGTWKAKGGEHDDRVMAFVWALMILFKEITQIYFEIDEEDDYGKPLKISPYDHGIKYFENATSIYTNEQVDKIENSNLSPMAFGAFGEADDEMAGLIAEGWQSLNGGMPYVDPSRSMSQEQYDSMNRWFS